METDLIKLLTPYEIGLEKERIGPDSDGGYVTAIELSKQSSELYTYGVGNDVRYEVDWMNRYGKKVWTYDHTCNGPRTGLINHTRQGIGWDDANLEDFFVHYNQNKTNGDILFKMDIEGGEYDYFLDSRFDYNKFKDIALGVNIEIHWISDSEYRNKFYKLMDLFNNDYVLYHIHGNVWGTVFDYNGFDIVDIIELSFARKDICNEITPNKTSYPTKLDKSNKQGGSDFIFKFLQ